VTYPSSVVGRISTKEFSSLYLIVSAEPDSARAKSCR
jgi:hypothetical protein